MNAAGMCACGWSHTVTEPEGGQTLFGTLGWHMAKHTGRTGHDDLAIDWSRTA